ncbi:MAG: DNA-binding domain-containing protein [Anaerovoracaceae bacterium]
MRYYIIDDDIAIVKALENIIEKNDLGEVAGYNMDPEVAIKEITASEVDIVLVDLLMDKKDGISVVKILREIKPSIHYIMISKVQDKEMVGEAYAAGVDFFINKPLNIIEIKKVLQNTGAVIKTQKVLSSIEGILDQSKSNQESVVSNKKDDEMRMIKSFLGMIGILGEKGSADILKTCEYIIESKTEYNRETLIEVSKLIGEPQKNVEQRIRRTIKKGLTNVAAIAVDDFGNEVVDIYAGYVYDFVSIKDEMECIKGKSALGGRIKINRFIEGILTYAELNSKK